MTTDKSNTVQDETRAPVRVWAPKVGERVRLWSISHYTSRALDPWTELNMIGDRSTGHTTQDDVIVCKAPEGKGGYPINVPLSSIQPPIGWQDRYTITVAADKVESVLGWFRDKRGIAVMQSHYMPSCPTAFAPADNQSEDWRFNGASVDVVAANECDKVFRVVRLDTWMDIGLPCACPYCVGGKRTRENNAVLVDKDTARCPHCGVVAGFSFDEPYHPAGYRYGYVEGMEMDNSQCAFTRPAAECWVCNGTGKGIRCLSSMDRKEKAQARKWLTAEGWEVRYINAGEHSYWVGERETVVKDWDVAVTAGEVQA